MPTLTLAVAFGAGLLSFLSPCVLPLIPGYLSFISGAGADELRSGSRRAGVLVRTLFFVLGFSAVFVGLGLVFSGGGMLTAGGSSRIISVLSGSIIVLLGLNSIFDFIKLFNAELRARVTAKPTNALGALLVGMAFGAGWTPCVGPILASILFMAARAGGALKAVALLSAYSVGLALPFLAAGLFFERLLPVWAWFKRHGSAVRIGSGLLLVLIGLSIALGRLSAVNAVSSRLGFSLKAAMAAGPDAVKIWVLGIIAALAAAITVPPLVARKRFARPVRLVVLALLAALFVLEALGLVRVEMIVSEWLLFQGA